MTLRTISIRRAGNRDNLFLGGDRELVLGAGLVAFALVIAAQTLFSIATGIVVWSASLYAARAMAKSDPKLRHVYLRHRHYQAYYPARSTPFRDNTPRQARRYR